MDPGWKEEIDRLLRGRDFSGLQGRLEGLEPSEVGGLWEELSPDDALTVYRALSRPAAAKVFAHLSGEQQVVLAGELVTDGDRLPALLNDLSPDVRTAFFLELPEAVVQHFLSLLNPKEKANAIRLLSYPEDSIGRLATTDYVALEQDWTIEQALQQIRRYGRDSEIINVLYVVDGEGRLVDDLRLRKILFAEPETKIDSLINHRFVALAATDDQETAVRVFQEHGGAALPVVDAGGVLLGIVTIDDVLDVAEEEATEDMQKLGGLDALDASYIETPLSTLVRKRAGWLAVLFVGEMFTATAMGYFESEIARAVVLALFVPLVISSGGNSGSQAASLIIRALAIGEIRLRDWWRVMGREVLSGLVLGGLLGVLGFLRVIVWARVFGLYGEHWFLLGLTVGLSLVGVVLWGTLAGAMLPFIMKRLGADPAVSSTPFVATLVDVTGLVIYFTVAALVLAGTLL